jgi:glycosyltransferase involved in cell wall biosynthesis
LLNQHRILAVPSRWEEPFGVVALEGIACGCVVVAADGGGLPEAIGPCGVTFARGDAGALAERFRELLRPGADLRPFHAAAPAHLARHATREVAARYLAVFREALHPRRAPRSARPLKA